MTERSISLAADCVNEAEAILVATGAGMGVDSGLPDFRGNQGFWRAYPAFEKAGLSFYDLANPVWFTKNPAQAWGFYGHRQQLYHQVTPHAGFGVLRKWGQQKPNGLFVFTSNVDGHFQKAGFDDSQIIECHGSIHHLQCTRPCSSRIWLSNQNEIEIDTESCHASGHLPECKQCKEIARPNILMFGDGRWISDRTDRQIDRYSQWLKQSMEGKTAMIEIGAGTAVPTVRYETERKLGESCRLIRINPRESQAPANSISIAAGGLETLLAIDELLKQ